MLSNHPNCLGGNGQPSTLVATGDVVGPASATDNAVARFDDTTGKLIQNSAVTIDDTGIVTTPDVTLGTSGPSVKSSLAARAARQGLVFDGTAGATVSNVAVLSTNDFTFSAFITPQSFATNAYISSGNVNGFGLALLTSGLVQINLVSVVGVGTSTSALVAGKSQHIVYTRSGTTGKIYINGIQDATFTDNKNYSSATGFVGMVYDGTQRFTGIISGHTFFNRALSATEVVSLYESGVPSGGDYNTASNTNLATSTVVASGGTLSGESATGFTMTSASGVAYVGTRPTFGATTTGLSGVAPVGSRWLVTFTATLTSGVAPSLSILQTNSFASISNTVTVTAGSNSVVLTTTANGTWVVCPTFYTTSASTYTISAITVTRQGLLLAPDAAQAGGGLAWYDTSGNAANITLPASGVTWNVPTSGRGIFADGTAAAPSISFSADSDTGFYRYGSNQIGIALGLGVAGYLGNGGSANKLQIVSGAGAGVDMNELGSIALAASGTNQNITLTPSGTGKTIIGGANQKTLIGTSVDSNALFQLGTDTTSAAGGMVFGTSLKLYRRSSSELAIDTASGSILALYTAGTRSGYFQSNSFGTQIVDENFGSSLSFWSSFTLALTLDNAQNAIFASGANIQWSGRTLMSSPTDGSLRLSNAAGNNFTRLQFGGTTSSFPALERTGTTLYAVLADGSAGTTMQAQNFTAVGSEVVVGAGQINFGGRTSTIVGGAGGATALPATPVGYMIVNVAGTNRKIPYYNS